MDKQPSYYDIPMLKASLWKWEVPVYFGAGGLAGGAYVLGRLADRAGGTSLRPLARAGTGVSLAALAPCPALLILDLGDPTRFHHMLRVFKPVSPMNVGSWTLTCFSGAVGAAVLREWLGPDHLLVRLSLPVADAAGVPLALMMTAYTGVLLSTTSTPVWTQNPWLGPLFSASAFEIASAAIAGVLEITGESGSRSTRVLEPISIVARLATTVTLGGYLVSAGSMAAPLSRGQYAPYLWGGAVGAGLLAPTLLDLVAKRSRNRRGLKIAASALAVAGGFALKWAIGSAGHPSGADPQAARDSSRRR